MSQRIRRILAWGDLEFYIAFGAWIVWLRHTHWNPRCWFGIVLAMTGLALWIAARRQLGRSFSLKAKATVLVSTGLYSKMRHPVYYSGFVAYLGIFLILGRWIPLLCFSVFYAAFELPRMVNEERVLAQAFGDAWREYCAHTWF